jgi:hypothetical protein
MNGHLFAAIQALARDFVVSGEPQRITLLARQARRPVPRT